MKTAALALALAGCASRDVGPDPNQPWMSLEDYARRLSSKTPFPLNPVVRVPEGTEVELRIDRQQISWIPDGAFLDGFEPLEEVVARVRVRARQTVYLDLEHLLASTDKETWTPLGFSLIPLCRESELTLRIERDASAVVVPIVAPGDEVRLDRALFKRPFLR
jgi:hypothetical protein